MPEPLATPVSMTTLFPDRNWAEANLGRKSVVIMACTKLFNACSVACRAAINSGSLLTIFSAGKGTPMIPVEDGNTSSGFTPRSREVSRQICRQARSPAGPVAQLAFPEFTSDRPHPASAGFERRAVDLQRRGHDSVPGEHGSGRGSSTGLDQRQIRASTGLDPSRDRGKSKAFG